jgi:hypothetical protein
VTESGDLREIERRAYRSTYQDGLYDLCYGIFLAAWAVVPVLKGLEVSTYLAVLPFLAVPAIILIVGKTYITNPRLGSARYGPKRMAQATRLLGVGAVALLVMYLLIIVGSVWGIRLSGVRKVGDLTLPLIESLVIFVGLSVLAYYSDFRRLYLYAFFVAAGILVAEFLYQYVGTPLDILLAFGIPALGIMVTGLVLFFGFLKKYPRPAREAANGT